MHEHNHARFPVGRRRRRDGPRCRGRGAVRRRESGPGSRSLDLASERAQRLGLGAQHTLEKKRTVYCFFGRRLFHTGLYVCAPLKRALSCRRSATVGPRGPEQTAREAASVGHAAPMFKIRGTYILRCTGSFTHLHFGDHAHALIDALIERCTKNTNPNARLVGAQAECGRRFRGGRRGAVEPSGLGEHALNESGVGPGVDKHGCLV